MTLNSRGIVLFTFLAATVLCSTVSAEKIRVIFRKPNWNTLDDNIFNDNPPDVDPVPPLGSTPEESTANEQLGKGDVTKGNLEEGPWSSNGWPRGGMHKNNTGKTITEIEIKLKRPDEFDESSATFTDLGTVTFSPDKRTMTISGLNIEPCDYFWSEVPWSLGADGWPVEQAEGGSAKTAKGVYTGRAIAGTPQPPKPAKKEKPDAEKDHAGDKKAGQDSGQQQQQSQSSFDGLGNFSMDLAPFQYVHFVPNHSVTKPMPWEDLIGAEVYLPPLALVGPSPDIPGAWLLKDRPIEVKKGNAMFLSGAIRKVHLVPDTSTPGYDSYIQGELIWTYNSGPVHSRFVKRIGLDLQNQRIMYFFIRTNLLAATANLTQPGVSNVEYEWALNSIEPLCAGDTNGDGYVDGDDFLAVFNALLSNQNCGDCPVDFNGDGVVNLTDLFLVRQAWGPCSP